MAISALFYCTIMATSTSFFETPGNEFPIAGSSARTPCVPEINDFWVEQLRAMTNWIAFFFLQLASLNSTPSQYRSISPAMLWALFSILLNQCVCASREVQRAFEDAILFSILQFYKHMYTVFCLLLYSAQMLGGFTVAQKYDHCLVFVLLQDTGLGHLSYCFFSCWYSMVFLGLK